MTGSQKRIPTATEILDAKKKKDPKRANSVATKKSPTGVLAVKTIDPKRSGSVKSDAKSTKSVKSDGKTPPASGQLVKKVTKKDSVSTSLTQPKIKEPLVTYDLGNETDESF